jgi:hypothetical protein
MGGRFSREKGKRGEREIAHLIPGAKRTWQTVGSSKGIVDDAWPGAVCQTKNCDIGGTAIADNLGLLQEAAPEAKHYVIYKPRRGTWIVCMTLDQWTKEVEGVLGTKCLLKEVVYRSTDFYSQNCQGCPELPKALVKEGTLTCEHLKIIQTQRARKRLDEREKLMVGRPGSLPCSIAGKQKGKAGE